MQNGTFNCIAVFDAVPEGELSTARRLHEDLSDLKSAKAEELKQLRLRYFRIESLQDLERYCQELLSESENNALIPWIHLDAHGLDDNSGFRAAGGSKVTWEAFSKLITPINVSTNCNIVLVLACCFGAYYIQSLRPDQRSPMLALVGPIREVLAGEVEADFKVFYLRMFDGFSFGEAVKAITETNRRPQYYATTAHELFLESWKGYKEGHCSSKSVKSRALQLILRLRQVRPDEVHRIGEIKRLIKDKEPEFFDICRDTLFICDIYPENSSRFPITYENAQKYAVR